MRFIGPVRTRVQGALQPGNVHIVSRMDLAHRLYVVYAETTTTEHNA